MGVSGVMLFSIITVAYNAEKTISRTMNSVHEQSYRDFEHIIIDGASSDNTISIVKEYLSDNLTIVSEPDDGIYDAMNKGVKIAKGDYVLFLNSDDHLKSPRTLEMLAVPALDDYDAICGGIDILEQGGDIVRHWPSDGCLYFGKRVFLQAPHPGFFAKRQILQEMDQPFDLSFRISADLNLMLQLFYQGLNFKFSKETVTSMYLGGASSHQLSARIEGWKESLIIYWRHFGVFSPLLLMIRIFSKFTKSRW